MDYRQHFVNALQRLKGEARYRSFAHIERQAGAFPHAVWHRPEGPRDIVVWCSNDYLGMGQHPDVVRAMVETAEATGVGAGGTRNISGTSRAVVDLEAELADLHGKEAALVFTSGYVSNQTGIATIARLPCAAAGYRGAPLSAARPASRPASELRVSERRNVTRDHPYFAIGDRRGKRIPGVAAGPLPGSSWTIVSIL